jgi:2-aminoadipate transaminase
MDQTALFNFVLRKREDVVSFALGLPNPDLFPVAELAAAADATFKGQPDVYQYANTLDELREHIVRLMAMRGVTCAPEQIVVTNGAQHGIDMAVRLLHGFGDPVILEEVTYSGALSAVSMRHASIHTIPVDVKTGSTADEVDRLIRAGVHPAFMYVMPEGHNPLGVSMPAPQRQALVATAREHEFTIVEDDAYGFLQYEHDQRPALRALDDRQVVYVGSFSKIISPGLRVGWIVVPDEFLSKAAAIKEASALDVATPGQYIVADLLDRWDITAHIGVLQREYGLRRDVMQRCLEAITPDGIAVSRPDSGMFFWMELPEDVDTRELLTVAVEQYGVSFVSGEVYFADQAKAKQNCLRLSFSCVSAHEIEVGMERLQKLFADRGIK